MVGNVLPRVTDETVIAKTKFLEFKELSYLNQFGYKRSWSLASRVGAGRTVMIVPYHGKKIVVTREFMAPAGGYCTVSLQDCSPPARTPPPARDAC